MDDAHSDESSYVFVPSNLSSTQISHFKILSLNCFCSVPQPIRFTGLHARADRFAEVIYPHAGRNCPIICMQELIFARSKILKSLTQHQYVTPVMQSTLFSGNIKFFPSGLCIACTYPLLEIRALLFDGPTYHFERVIAKGALYVKTCLPEVGNVHVINTHLNAWSGTRADRARSHQVEQMADWIRTLNIHESEPLFILGDFNIDAYEHMTTVTELMEKLQCKIVLPSETQFSFDPLNNSLVGLDDPSEYQTLSKQKGCIDEYIATGTCVCCPRQLVDLAGYSLDHAKPLQIECDVVPMTTLLPFQIQIRPGVHRDVQTISDHSAIALSVKVPKMTHTPTEGQHSTSILYNETRYDWKVILLQLILTLVFFSLIYLWLRTRRK